MRLTVKEILVGLVGSKIVLSNSNYELKEVKEVGGEGYKLTLENKEEYDYLKHEYELVEVGVGFKDNVREVTNEKEVTELLLDIKTQLKEKLEEHDIKRTLINTFEEL